MELPLAIPEDEYRHPFGEERYWQESYYLDFFSPDGSVGGYVRIGLYPNLGAAWYWGCVVGPDRPLVTVIDHTVPLPADDRTLEVRASGLWADHNVETPLEHFSLGLEAFGVALDDPAEVYGEARGERTPLGFDLEWETDGTVFRYPEGMDRYEIPCRVHGEILVGSERIELDGFGQRDHSWGHRDWWTMGWCWTAFRMEDGARFHAVTVKPSIGFAIGYDAEPGAELEVVTTFDADETLGGTGIPTGAQLTVNERHLAMEPIAWSPVGLVSPDGQATRFPRALARFTEDTGRTGLGWIEFNQPQAPV